MLRISLILSLAISMSAPASAAAPLRRAILFGGNCDESNRANIFHETFQKIAGALSKRQWDVVPLFDGERSRCTVPMSDPRCASTPSSPPPFCCPSDYDRESWNPASIGAAANRSTEVPRASKEELFKALDDAKTLPAGSQLLLMIYTHGSPALDGKEHAVCLSDGTLMNIDDPDFTKRLEYLAQNQKIRLGITDESCFGGGSIAPLEKYGCVVSAQTENRVAWGSPLSNALSALTKDGQTVPPLNGTSPSLEDVFFHALLDVRNGGSERNNPQIAGYKQTEDLSEEAAKNIVAEDAQPQPLHDRYDAQHRCDSSVRTSFDDFATNLDSVIARLATQTDPYRDKLEKYLVGTDSRKILSSSGPRAQDLPKLQTAIAENDKEIERLKKELLNQEFDISFSLQGLPTDAGAFLKKKFSDPTAHLLGYDHVPLQIDPHNPNLASIRIPVYAALMNGSSLSIDDRAKQLGNFVKQGMPSTWEKTETEQILGLSFKKALAPMYRKFEKSFAQIDAAVQKGTDLSARYRAAVQNAHQEVMYLRGLDYLRWRDNNKQNFQADSCRNFPL